LIIEQPSLLYRLLFPEALWRLPRQLGRRVYLTFDDGPVPEVTPWVLDLLAGHGIKATFFMVGDNVRRHPEIFARIRAEGHSYGNHTMHHLQGFKTRGTSYMADIDEADAIIRSHWFRPPHGLVRWSQARMIKDRFNIVMYDLVTRDYSRKLNPEQVFDNVRRYARNGSIIVFHDSVKAWPNMHVALPRAIDWLTERGYTFGQLPM